MAGFNRWRLTVYRFGSRRSPVRIRAPRLDIEELFDMRPDENKRFEPRRQYGVRDAVQKVTAETDGAKRSQSGRPD